MKKLAFIVLAALGAAAINSPAYAWSEWVSYNGGKPVCESHEGTTTMAGTYKDQKCGLLAFKPTNGSSTLVRNVAPDASSGPSQGVPVRATSQPQRK